MAQNTACMYVVCRPGLIRVRGTSTHSRWIVELAACGAVKSEFPISSDSIDCTKPILRRTRPCQDISTRPPPENQYSPWTSEVVTDLNLAHSEAKLAQLKDWIPHTFPLYTNSSSPNQRQPNIYDKRRVYSKPSGIRQHIQISVTRDLREPAWPPEIDPVSILRLLCFNDTSLDNDHLSTL